MSLSSEGESNSLKFDPIDYKFCRDTLYSRFVLFWGFPSMRLLTLACLKLCRAIAWKRSWSLLLCWSVKKLLEQPYSEPLAELIEED